jgi:hypothetical protein
MLDSHPLLLLETFCWHSASLNLIGCLFFQVHCQRHPHHCQHSSQAADCRRGSHLFLALQQQEQQQEQQHSLLSLHALHLHKQSKSQGLQ